jgi:hypothetical protein
MGMSASGACACRTGKGCDGCVGRELRFKDQGKEVMLVSAVSM